jgi:hypothetical protein
VSLYPAEHRAVRELHATARALASHWSALAGRLGGDAAGPLRDGAAAARSLLGELDAQVGLPAGYPAAQGVGGWLAAVRGTARDLVLERNQALRLALLDLQHVTTLLGYLGALAEARDGELAAFFREWEARLRVHERAVADAVLALAAAPEDAVAPADPGPAGRAGAGLADAIGTFGEAFDASVVGRAARRLGGRRSAAGPR